MQDIELLDYSIHLGSINDSLDKYLSGKPSSPLFLLADKNTQEHCLPVIESRLKNRSYSVFVIKAGEIHKNIDTCIDVWKAMTEANLDRHAIMLNIGGGVICDLGGFCASTYKRGISFVQIPTTLLSQVDASIGGKLGIDFEGYKNHIGVFRSPETVLIDPVFLHTLSDRELRSGYAEVIKHCLIADGDHWKEITEIHDLKNTHWTKIIRRSLEVKRKIVMDDPYEKNKRKLLNFGHTIGHAIESHFLHSASPLLHGEAIAAGMIYETMLSAKQLRLRNHEQNEIINYIMSLYGKPPALNMKAWLPIMKQDKKNINGKISFSLLRDIGVSEWDVLLGEQELNELK
jgi:3-dehydroquinate synthase